MKAGERDWLFVGPSCLRDGHAWKFIGCRACGCERSGGCSIPVHRCTVCNDCDYGENEEACRIEENCEHASERRAEAAARMMEDAP